MMNIRSKYRYLPLNYSRPTYCNVIYSARSAKRSGYENSRRDFEKKQWVSKIADHIFIQAVDVQDH